MNQKTRRILKGLSNTLGTLSEFPFDTTPEFITKFVFKVADVLNEVARTGCNPDEEAIKRMQDEMIGMIEKYAGDHLED